MSFHPDNNLPGCMMPDGGECCAGHAAVCEDWHKQRQRIHELEAWQRARLEVGDLHMERIVELESALREIAKGEGTFSRDPLTHAANTIKEMRETARAALPQSSAVARSEK